MPFNEVRLELTSEALAALREILEQTSGFVLRDEFRFLAERRLAPRLNAVGARDFEGYIRHLKYDAQGPQEIEEALEALVPRETYFFREKEQLDSFQNEVLPLLAANNRDRQVLRIWSAGCSTGEEAYSLAMLIDSSHLFDGWHVEVFGSDFSRRALGQARLGEYPESALRVTSAQQRQHYFTQLPENRFSVKAHFRQQVRFGRVNLVEKPSLGLPVDVVFCRNVLIYFERPTRRAVIDTFYQQLRPGGFLFLGHSENLLSEATRFTTWPLKGDLAYRKLNP